MGILDDAIREHLELKRRRGADPAEIERLERDAFGPLHRPGEHDDSGGDRADLPPAVQLPADYRTLQFVDVERSDQLDGDPVESDVEPHGLYEPGDRPIAAEEPLGEQEPLGGQEPLGESPLAEPLGEEDVIVEEDVLEETPEFLQDTPEHDRLWFEQAPPRDFDFGG